MIAEEIKIECEENGFHLCVDGETWLIADPEALYDHVKATIGPWLREREEALRTMPVPGFGENVFSDESGYDRDDPKSPGYHERMSEIADQRDAFKIWQDEDR